MKNPIIKCSVRSVKSSRWCQGQTNHKDKCPRNTCERSLTSPVIKEVQIKVGYHFPLIGLAKMNNKNNTITFRPKGAHRHQWVCVCVCICPAQWLRAWLLERGHLAPPNPSVHCGILGQLLKALLCPLQWQASHPPPSERKGENPQEACSTHSADSSPTHSWVSKQLLEGALVLFIAHVGVYPRESIS